MARRIREANPVYLVGLGSRILHIAEIQREIPYRVCPRLRSIVCTADTVARDDEESLQATFGPRARVTNRYGSYEFTGNVAQGCPLSRDVLHWNPEQNYVEVTDDAGQCVANGQVGSILITDLHNFAMPFVRYAIGDATVAQSSSCGHGWPSIGRVAGRSGTVFVTPDGQRITEEFVATWMRKGGFWGELREYQLVIKAGNSAYLKAVLHSSRKGDLTSLTERLLALLRERLGPSMHIDIEFCDQIERSPSGKRPVIVRAGVFAKVAEE